MKSQIRSAYVVVLVIIALIIGAVSGWFAKPVAPPAPPVELTVYALWSGVEEKNFRLLLDAFTEKTGIKYKYVPQPEEARATIPPMLEAGLAPADVMIFPWIAWLKDLAKRGHLMDLSDIVAGERLMPTYVELGKVNGKNYICPFKAWVKPGFWYKKSFFAKHGLTPPKTYDEFVALLKKLKGIPGIEAPIASGDADGWPLTDVTEAFIIGLGGPELQLGLIERKIKFTDPQVREVFSKLRELLEAGYFSVPDEWTGQITKLWDEKYGIYFMGNWMTVMPQVKDVADLSFFPFPGTKGVVAGGDWMVIPKYTKHPKEARALAKWLASEDAQVLWVRQGGWLATNLDVPADAYKPADKAVVDFLATVKPVPDLDDVIGGRFLPEFRSLLKTFWVKPEIMDEMLKALQATLE